MTQITRCALFFSLLISPLACGGEDDDGDKGSTGSTTVESGLDGSKPVNTLTQQEVEQLGKSFADSASSQELINGICSFTGVFASSLGAAGGGGGGNTPSCEELVSQCKESAKSTPAEVQSQTGALPNQATAFASCNITVGELETCLSASLKAMAEVFGSVKCGSDLSMIDLSAASAAGLTECQNISAQCPTVLPQGSGGDDF